MSFRNLNDTFDPSQRIHGDLAAYMAHAPLIVNFLNQVACGTLDQCVAMGRELGGSDDFGRALYYASREIVTNKFYDKYREENAHNRNEIEQGPLQLGHDG